MKNAVLLLLLTTTAYAAKAPTSQVLHTQGDAQLTRPLDHTLLPTGQLYLHTGHQPPRLLFDAQRYGKSAVLFNATFGPRNTVYVLANLPREGTTILDIDTRTRRVTRQFALCRLQIENVSPSTFTYDPRHDTLTILGDRGYTTRGGIPDANSAHFDIGPMHQRKLRILRQKPL